MRVVRVKKWYLQWGTCRSQRAAALLGLNCRNASWRCAKICQNFNKEHKMEIICFDCELPSSCSN